jgi:diketogulonate reductase-like aldo/keto reductase
VTDPIKVDGVRVGDDRVVRLASGDAMPMVGFGTWRLAGDQGYAAVRHAIDVGYRHLDTATMYRNEAEVGRAVRDSGVPREQIFITTKLPAERVGQEQRTLAESLRALGTEYVDLWLVHWPPGGRATPETWQRLLAARERGLARAVGVSNYSVEQLDGLVAATGRRRRSTRSVVPSRHDAALLAAHRAAGVLVQGYSPLKGSDLHHPTLVGIAADHGVTPAQVVLRWHLRHGIVVIPKSERPDRIRTNLDLYGFTLTDGERDRIDRLAED